MLCAIVFAVCLFCIHSFIHSFFEPFHTIYDHCSLPKNFKCIHSLYCRCGIHPYTVLTVLSFLSYHAVDPAAMEAGEGYRYTLGLVSLLINLLIVVVGQTLLYVRRNHHPVKDYNPVLLSLMLYHLLGAALWVSLPEMGLIALPCGANIWLMNILAVWYGKSLNAL